MNADQTQVIQECTQGALTGELTFPEIVGKLAQIGVERYHADYSRGEITYYLADGDSQGTGEFVVRFSFPPHTRGIITRQSSQWPIDEISLGV